jgi:hypothetical protein
VNADRSTIVWPIFLILGLLNWFWPNFPGGFAPASISAGEGRIVGAIFLVGAGIIWCNSKH